MEESVTCRGPCKKTWAKFGRSSFLRHIKQATKCKEKYTDKEIIDLEHASEERVRNMKKRRHQKLTTWRKDRQNTLKINQKYRQSTFKINQKYRQSILKINNTTKILALKKADSKTFEMKKKMGQFLLV